MIDYLPSLLVLIVFALHVRGERRAAVLTGRRRSREARQRARIFYAGLLTILIALCAPLDSLADRLFWVHMIQHLLLLVVAAPLIVLGQPWLSIWRPLPLRLRRVVAGSAVRAGWLAPLRGTFRALSRPAGAWLAFNLALIIWHLPGPYDLTLRNTNVHIAEHATFLAAGILFWSQVAAVAPSPNTLSIPQRVGYVASASVVNIGLSMYLAFAQHPLYNVYATLAHRPGGISALADQQMGAGFMWTAGDMPFAIAIALLVQRWLAANEAATEALGPRVEVSAPR
ncbi:MAG TPA: cytochrome c oxidase assembly protein [Solirubrobacteraceae bacterium]|nr:cytochrome c oxidase assembly protein [Solirubrobacteraceae bacterium]